MISKKRSAFVRSWNLLLLGQILFFVGLLYHLEKFQKGLGISWTAVILALSLLFCLLSIGILIWKRQWLTKSLSLSIQRFGRLSSFLAVLFSLGLVSLLGLLFFHSLLANFFNPTFFSPAF
jgi:hypothetical protein